MTKPFKENAELGRIWQLGLKDFNAHSAEEQARFFHATYQFLKAFGTIHFHCADGLLARQLRKDGASYFDITRLTPGIAH